MLQVVPTLCLHLTIHDHIMWPHSGEWWLFCVIHQWRDGAIVRCEASHRECFLPSTQWVAKVERNPSLDTQAVAHAHREDILRSTAKQWHQASLTFQLDGHSMGSMIPQGATIDVVPVDVASLAVGQVLVASASHLSGWIAHRIVSIHWSDSKIVQMLTKGDANRVVDAPIALERVLGRVSCVSFQERSWNPEAWNTRCLSILRDQSTRWSRKIRRNLPFA